MSFKIGDKEDIAILKDARIIVLGRTVNANYRGMTEVGTWLSQLDDQLTILIKRIEDGEIP